MTGTDDMLRALDNSVNSLAFFLAHSPDNQGAKCVRLAYETLLGAREVARLESRFEREPVA